MVIFQSATTRASCVVMSACVHQIYTLLISIARSYLDMTWLGAGGMGRRRYIPSCISALIFAALCLSVAHGQTTDNSTTSTADSSSVVVTDSCVAESCGISSCDAGSELGVSLDSDSLVITCTACIENYFKSEEGSEACEACPEGLVSEVGATSCALEEGFWRTSNASLTAYECPNTDACVGGSDEASYCDDGFQGPLCAVCLDDYYPSGSYDCVACSTGNAASTIITIVIFVSVLAVFILLVNKAAEQLEERTRDNGAEVDENANEAAMMAFTGGGGNKSKIFDFIKKWKDTLVVRFKIIVAHFQVVGTFPQVLDVQWPDAFNRYADKISIFTLDIWGILSQGCYFRSDFLNQLIFTTILPLGIVGVLVGLYYKSVRNSKATARQRQAAWDRTTGGVLLTGFFFYIITSTLVLKSFDCQDFDDGTSYLRADYSISCNSTRYTFIKWYSIIMVIIFPVGIPVTYLAVLYRGRARINPDPHNPELSATVRDEDPTIQKTKFLWGTYRPAVYWYECWECVRKLLLTGLLVYFKEGTPTQVVIAILITLSGLRVLSGLSPYLRDDENALAEASLWVTFLTLFAGLLIKAEVTEDDGYDEVALGVVLSFTNMAIVGLAGFQLLWATSMWFREKLGFTNEDKLNKYREDRTKSTDRRRRSAPAVVERPPSTNRPVVNAGPPERPRSVDQPHPVQKPRTAQNAFTPIVHSAVQQPRPEPQQPRPRPKEHSRPGYVDPPSQPHPASKPRTVQNSHAPTAHSAVQQPRPEPQQPRPRSNEYSRPEHVNPRPQPHPAPKPRTFQNSPAPTVHSAVQQPRPEPQQPRPRSNEYSRPGHVSPPPQRRTRPGLNAKGHSPTHRSSTTPGQGTRTAGSGVQKAANGVENGGRSGDTVPAHDAIIREDSEEWRTASDGALLRAPDGVASKDPRRSSSQR